MSKLQVWSIIIFRMGPVSRVGRQIDEVFRYYVLNTIKEIGLFEYLKTPHSYGQILTEFSFADSEYTRELIETLVQDKEHFLLKENGLYKTNEKSELPVLTQILNKIDKRYHSFTLIAEGMNKSIIPRAQNRPVELSSSFEADGRQLLVKFDRGLGNKIYTAMRDAAFANLKKSDKEWLHGKRLLDVGCGSGRESAEIWLNFDGNIKIIGIDPVESMIEHAKQTFDATLKEIKPDHSPLTEENRPEFKVGSVHKLEFDDNTFDAAFYSQVLHWTPDPQKAISEIVRVVKPGGVIFGAQGGKPYSNPYMDLVIRTNENCHGFFWMEEYKRWYADHNLYPEVITPAGIFAVRNMNSVTNTK